MNDDQIDKFACIDGANSRDTYVNNLLKAIDEIEPNKLGNTSYIKYIKQLSEISRAALKHDSTCWIHILEAIKSCEKPCYRRDVLLEVLNQIVLSPKSVLAQLLREPFNNNLSKAPWKILANSIVTIPDVVANKNALKKFPGFQPKEFFAKTLVQLYRTIVEIHNDGLKICEDQICFYIQILGRIAFSGFRQLVWEEYTSKLFMENRSELKLKLSTILTYPLRIDSQIAPQFELFIEPLYIPIFFNLKPSKNSGMLIKSVLNNHILSHESFQYVICNKSIFQVNYKYDRRRQAIILFNIFAYISCLKMSECESKIHDHPSNLPSNKNDNNNLLIKTLLEIAKSWSNNTKILFRSCEQSRYLTSAFIIAFRYALEHDKQELIKNSGEIQACIMHGFSIYLNRTTSDCRHLALCIGESVLQTLHELIDKNLSKDQQTTREPLKLDFGIELDDISLSIKRLLIVDLDGMFDDYNDVRLEEASSKQYSTTLNNCLALEQASQSNSSLRLFEESTRNSPDYLQYSNKDSAKRAVIELDSDSDDLSPHEMSDDNDFVADNDEFIGSDSINIPIYLQDCIDGLIENNNPRYVRLCLLKADELTRQLSQQEAIEDEIVDSFEKQNRLRCSKASDAFVNDAIRDIAREIAQILLYLDDQYIIKDFDALRMNALCSLCVAAPDLVVKFLLDEFNGNNRSTRHQLDILQALVTSAKNMATDKFVKYVSLYFYGIIHQLKDYISPALIVSVANDNRLDDSYLLSRIFFSISLIVECVNQQPITCKLSNDLIDILANYRYHSDSGVRKAVASCLVAIRDYTPGVYFKEYLYDKIVNLFGDWLAIELESQL